MTNNPWTKLILVSLGGIVVSLALLWSLQQINIYNYYNNYRIHGRSNMSIVQQGMIMDNNGHMNGMMDGM